MIPQRVFSFLVLSLLAFPGSVSAQEQLGVLCIKGSSIAVRTKCLSGEKVATVSLLTKKGLTGDTGAAGRSGAPGREMVSTNQGFNTVFQSGTTFIESCPVGKIVVGGGCYSLFPTVAVTRSHPSDTQPGQWLCLMKPRNNNSPTGVGSVIFTFAVCVDS